LLNCASFQTRGLTEASRMRARIALGKITKEEMKKSKDFVERQSVSKEITLQRITLFKLKMRQHKKWFFIFNLLSETHKCAKKPMLHLHC
jgi:hypothetical protein